jgi:sister chromatid cohesion protein PDS5
MCILVKKLQQAMKCYTIERLADIYKMYCQRGLDSSTNSDDLSGYLEKIVRCLYEKYFR